MRFDIAAEVHAPPAVVWNVMFDVERWPEWTPSVTLVERLEDGPFVVGSRARILQPSLRPAVWRVTDVREGRAFTWVMEKPGIRVIATHSAEANGDGTLAALSIRYEGMFGRLAGWVTGGLTRRYLAVEIEGLKERSESLHVAVNSREA